jgi:hypothetical protein
VSTCTAAGAVDFGCQVHTVRLNWYGVKLIPLGYGPACYIYTEDYKITTPTDNYKESDYSVV